ncbi:MAG: histidine ammonia-lyase [Candidatus Parvibacillus calidus]|nr:MAG: histidine ammonia-lyase [Candidatus Parvibacillus calidus]
MHHFTPGFSNLQMLSMSLSLEVSSPDISSDKLEAVFKGKATLVISSEALQRIDHCHQYLQNRIHTTDDKLYGINTGFGSLCNVVVDDDNIGQLQINLIRSHACGAGNQVPPGISRIILFLKIRSLSYGNSGVTTELVQRLIDMFNDDAIPVMYEQGSLGASGDLAPLAHMSLPLIGEGLVHYRGSIISGGEYLELKGLTTYTLKAKEGLALINGTQFSLAYLQASYLLSEKLLRAANTIAAMSIEGFDCRLDPFHPSIHAVRPHNGQVETATFFRDILSGSEHMQQPAVAVQDPYSFRCIPQVHGATYNAMQHIGSVIEGERNSVTDNPNVFADEGLVISGGNFHAQPLALASDYLSIAVAELGSISERRLYLLVSGQRGLSPFLVTKPGLQSGFMIAQYTAASIVSLNKQLASPSCVDSIVSSNGQEDHVSMAANAGVKLWQIVNNVATVLSIEWMAACQAVEMKQYSISPVLKNLLDEYRKYVPFVDEDRVLHNDFIRTQEFFDDIKWFKKS